MLGRLVVPATWDEALDRVAEGFGRTRDTTDTTQSFGIFSCSKASNEMNFLAGKFARQVMGRPFAAPPGIPADRRQALIKAFEDTLQDAEFLAEAQKLSIDVAPVSAARLDKMLGELYATPKAVLQKAAQAVAK